MDTFVRTLPLPSAVRPVREHGASALDRSVNAWPAPDAAARILDRWGMPIIALTQPAVWPAPDPAMRFDTAAPVLEQRTEPIDGRIQWAELVEPRVTVPIPDLEQASRAAIGAPVDARPAPAWPPPALDTAAPTESTDSMGRRVSTRVIVGVAAAAGTVVAGAAALVALL